MEDFFSTEGQGVNWMTISRLMSTIYGQFCCFDYNIYMLNDFVDADLDRSSGKKGQYCFESTGFNLCDNDYCSQLNFGCNNRYSTHSNIIIKRIGIGLSIPAPKFHLMIDSSSRL